MITGSFACRVEHMTPAASILHLTRMALAALAADRLAHASELIFKAGYLLGLSGGFSDVEQNAVAFRRWGLISRIVGKAEESIAVRLLTLDLERIAARAERQVSHASA
jgi:hypothetical protein